jgi:hypothetical protein
MTHVYRWANNSVRATWCGCLVRIVVSGARNTVLIEDVAGRRMTTSRRALRRVR